MCSRTPVVACWRSRCAPRPHSMRSRHSPSIRRSRSVLARCSVLTRRARPARPERRSSSRRGSTSRTVEFARSVAVPIVPGIATASELQAAWNFGLEFVKVFPASTLAGRRPCGCWRRSAPACASCRQAASASTISPITWPFRRCSPAAARGSRPLRRLPSAISTVSHAALQRRWRSRVRQLQQRVDGLRAGPSPTSFRCRSAGRRARARDPSRTGRSRRSAC